MVSMRLDRFVGRNLGWIFGVVMFGIVGGALAFGAGMLVSLTPQMAYQATASQPPVTPVNAQPQAGYKTATLPGGVNAVDPQMAVYHTSGKGLVEQFLYAGKTYAGVPVAFETVAGGVNGTLTLAPSKGLTLSTARVTVGGFTSAPNGRVGYTVTDNSLMLDRSVSIDSVWFVTAQKPGTYTLTATWNGHRATFHIAVLAIPAGGKVIGQSAVSVSGFHLIPQMDETVEVPVTK